MSLRQLSRHMIGRLLVLLFLLNLLAPRYAGAFNPTIFLEEYLTALAKEAAGVPEAVDIAITVLKDGDEKTLEILTALAREKEKTLTAAYPSTDAEQGKQITEALHGIPALYQQIAQRTPNKAMTPFFLA
jgi:hypothetical protein